HYFCSMLGIHDVCEYSHARDRQRRPTRYMRRQRPPSSNNLIHSPTTCVRRWLVSGASPAAASNAEYGGCAASQDLRCFTASHCDNSLVWLTPSASSTSGSRGSAVCARIMAAMA
ncbi:hypothetical protein Vretimale_175, partial [Volvox reticuliferus]